MKTKNMYRLRSKDTNEKFCFIGSTVNIQDAYKRYNDAMTNASSKLAHNSIFTYIKENGGSDLWMFEQIPKNENGDIVHQLTKYEVNEYENMTEESQRSIARRCYQHIYRKQEKYECICGVILNKSAKKQHNMSIHHIQYIRILEHNKKHKIHCECGLWIEGYRFKSHLKSTTHKKRMELSPHERN